MLHVWLAEGCHWHLLPRQNLLWHLLPGSMFVLLQPKDFDCLKLQICKSNIDISQFLICLFIQIQGQKFKYSILGYAVKIISN